jgi:cell division protein FtsI (penicillin-binding protein 3)
MTPDPDPCLATRRIQWLSRLTMTGIFLVLVVVVGRVAQLKIAPSKQLDGTQGARSASSPQPRFRGTVYDRKGRTLSIDKPAWLLAVDPNFYFEHGHRRITLQNEEISSITLDDELCRFVGPMALMRQQFMLEKAARLSEELSQHIEIEVDDIKRALIESPGSKRYLVLKKLLEDWEVDRVRNWIDGRNIGLMLDRRTTRVNYGPDSLAMIVGKVRNNGRGGSGIEQLLDKNLMAHDGMLLSRRTAGGTVISVPQGSYREGNHGDDFQLTIDLHIQQVAEARLAEQLEAFNAGGGRCLVIDPRNGDILAMVDLLRRRPNWEEAILDDPMRRIEPSLGRNRNLVDAFEPGSTFKPFIWSGAVQAGVGSTRPIPTDSQGRIKVNLGPVPISGRRNTVKDAGINPYHGPLKDIETILIRSLNTGMVEMVRPLSNNETREILVRFGFGSRTNCGLGGTAEHAGQITSLNKWSFANTSVSVSFGHEVSVTTLQMSRAFSAFCNRGLMPQLRLVKPSLKSKDTPVLDSAPLLMSRAIPGEIADRTKRALGKVVTEGTLRRHAKSSLYSMFGKSGTADLPKPGGGYFKDRHTSNVIAAAPYADPQVLVICVIDDPDKSIGYYGGMVAGPVVKDIVEMVLDYEGVAPDLESDENRDSSTLASRIREATE